MPSWKVSMSASMSNQTSHFGIMGGLYNRKISGRSSTNRATSRLVIPQTAKLGMKFMRKHNLLSKNPQGSGGVGPMNKVTSCNCMKDLGKKEPGHNDDGHHLHDHDHDVDGEVHDHDGYDNSNDDDDEHHHHEHDHDNNLDYSDDHHHDTVVDEAANFSQCIHFNFQTMPGASVGTTGFGNKQGGGQAWFVKTTSTSVGRNLLANTASLKGATVFPLAYDSSTGEGGSYSYETKSACDDKHGVCLFSPLRQQPYFGGSQLGPQVTNKAGKPIYLYDASGVMNPTDHTPTWYMYKSPGGGDAVPVQSSISAVCTKCSNGYIPTQRVKNTQRKGGSDLCVNLNNSNTECYIESDYSAGQTSYCNFCDPLIDGCLGCPPKNAGFGAAMYGSTIGCAKSPTGSYSNDGLNAVQCPPGQFQPNTGQTSCNKCADGYEPNPDRTICNACSSGTAGTGGECNKCGAGQQQNSKKTTCVDCSAGTVETNGTCSPCGTGKYQPKPKQTSCLDCSAGKYQPKAGQTSCLDCSAGKYQPNTGQATCLPCATGCAENQQLLGCGGVKPGTCLDFSQCLASTQHQGGGLTGENAFGSEEQGWYCCKDQHDHTSTPDCSGTDNICWNWLPENSTANTCKVAKCSWVPG